MGKMTLGYVLGFATMFFIVLGCMFTGTPFKSMPMKRGIEEGRGIVNTEKFLVVFEGMDNLDDASSGYFTYAGKDGIIPAFWRGYGTSRGYDGKGVTMETYEPGRGNAMLILYTKMLRVEEDGQFLKVGDKRIPIGEEKIIAVVDEENSCRKLTGNEAEKLLATIPDWYLKIHGDGWVTARPPNSPPMP